jgi:hypothetical protein
MTKRWLVRIVYLLLATLALANGGCLGLVIGGAVGGAAAGYALYQRGEWYRDYPATLNDAALAVTTALGELQLPVVNEKRDDNDIIIDSRTADDVKIHIHLTLVPSRIPADGAITHISIRVGALGDEGLSTRVHEQISLHLVAPVQMRTPPTPTPVPTTSGSLPLAPLETKQPPLAK